MICQNCGLVGDEEIPELSYDPEKLGTCDNCGSIVVAAGTTKNWEASKLATVQDGTRREQKLMEALLDAYDADEHIDRGQFKDIDRELRSNGETTRFVEVKERSCTLNGYRKTKFPFAKIESAQELSEEYGVPVDIVLKFRDAWAALEVEPDGDYEQGDDPFAPNYRPSQQDKDRQVPVKYPVEQLDVLDIDEFCEPPEEILDDEEVS